uniref:EGF-like domain-containing protein n=1 Tax=Amphimedon queenslandica TaxID=400682 RepID=A0A1X7SU79_AMPQE
IDECIANNNGGCDQNCTNTIGSFECSCTDGYYLMSDCEGTLGCSQLCTNTIGSYTCTCDNGYQLTNDNHTCTDIDEYTLDNNGGCEQTCHIILMVVIIVPVPMDTLSILMITTVQLLDINERFHYNSNCSHSCTNIPGSYVCSCSIEYNLNIDGRNCSSSITV